MMEPMKRMEPVKEFLECMAEIPERKIFVEKTDVPLFCMELLPALEQCFECTKENFDEQQYGVAIPEFSIYLDAPQTDMITCRPQVQYDKKYTVCMRPGMWHCGILEKKRQYGK